MSPWFAPALALGLLVLAVGIALWPIERVAPPIPPAGPSADWVRIRVQSDPPCVRVQDHGNTPLEFRAERGVPFDLKVMQPGYGLVVRRIQPDENMNLFFEMHPRLGY